MSEQMLSTEIEEQISDFLQNLKFRKRVFGGVDELDVWNKIRELNDIYRKAWLAERARYDALLAEKEREVDAE